MLNNPEKLFLAIGELLNINVSIDKIDPFINSKISEVDMDLIIENKVILLHNELVKNKI